MTLKGPKGNVVDIVAGDDVKNFDQIKVGDLVVARYAQALTLELRKTKAAAGARRARGGREGEAGDRPAVAGARQVTVIADVIAVDPKESTITLKGPQGQRRDARRAEPRPVQGRQEGRPGRGDLHRSARAVRRAGAEAGGSEEVSAI